jgi:hypothetical protein
MTDNKNLFNKNDITFVSTKKKITYGAHPCPLPQLTSEWNDLLNEVSNFSGKATFSIIMTVPNHLKDLINGFINRKCAIENTKLTLEAIWNVIAPTP